MKKRKQNPIAWIIGIVLIIIVSVIAFTPLQTTPTIIDRDVTPVTGTKIGNLAPGFTLETLNGEVVNLQDSRGKAVIVNFWATWCPPCREEMPMFQKYFEENDELMVIGVNLQETNLDAMKSFAEELGVTFPLVLDPDEEVKRAYNVFTQPVSYFIDKNGVIVEKKFGLLAPEEAEEKLKTLLKVNESGSTVQESEVKFLESDYPAFGIPAGTPYVIHPSDIRSGGPPKDGIPSIDNPKFTDITGGDEWLNAGDIVLSVDYNGVQKVYPLRILQFHEIVNDEFDRKPVLITYCPLCRSGVAFEPIIEGEAVEFGTSGKLFNSDLVMYDRKTDTYWSQILGKGILGELAGAKLKQIPAEVVLYGDWKVQYPNSQVLSTDTGFPTYSNTGRYLEPNLYGTDRPGFVGIGIDFTDTRLESNAIVFGVTFNGETKAYAEETVSTEKVINDEVGGQKILVIWDNNINTVKIFKSDRDFTWNDGYYTDGERWRVLEIEEAFERVAAFGHFWFAWVEFYPDTGLY